MKNVDQKKLSTFLGLAAPLIKTGSVMTASGNWLVMESPYKWGDTAADGKACKDHIQSVKDAGFKSAFIRGGRLGVNVKDVAKAA